jgi:hypothetical protein
MADETRTLQLDDAIVETGKSDGTIEHEAIPEYLEWDEDKSADEESINLQLKANAKSVFFK